MFGLGAAALARPAFGATAAEQALEMRIAKDQRKDDGYLRSPYWNSFTHPRFAQYTMAIAGILENDRLASPPHLRPCLISA